jgi:hypothetical protein
MDVADNKMKEKVFIEFLEAVKSSKSLEKLGVRHVVSKNSVSSNEKTEDITKALISLVHVIILIFFSSDPLIGKS